MAKELLAILGGRPVIEHPLRPYSSLGHEEESAVLDVMRSGVLSAFLGSPGEGFLGGPKVREFEEAWANHFGVRHAISVNSWTSGLIAIIGSLDLEPGDEIITSPWTMSATATAILHCNAIPIFADIESTFFCLDPVSVENAITPRTRAILAVDIFGQSADIPKLAEIARRHGIRLITDSAQSPGAYFGSRPTGTLADIGGFSLNYHKHIQTGEGGIVVTNDDELAERVALIRNHGENFSYKSRVALSSNIRGFNFRLGELEAAIGVEQLKKLAKLVESRQIAADQLRAGISDLPGLTLPKVRDLNTHAYYVFGMKIDLEFDTPRQILLDALAAEGVTGIFGGYTCLYRAPLYQEILREGRSLFPWNLGTGDFAATYSNGICPTAEDLHDNSFIGFEMCAHMLESKELEKVITAFQKVWRLRSTLHV